MQKNNIKPAHRIIAAAVAIAITLLFTVLYLSAIGLIDLGLIFGVCGFKQVTQLPCPGCGITTASKAFVKGNIIQAFYIQPAAAVLCILTILLWLFTLLISLFGVDFGLLSRIKFADAVKYIVVALIVILAGGWMVTLARAIMSFK